MQSVSIVIVSVAAESETSYSRYLYTTLPSKSPDRRPTFIRRTSWLPVSVCRSARSTFVLAAWTFIATASEYFQNKSNHYEYLSVVGPGPMSHTKFRSSEIEIITIFQKFYRDSIWILGSTLIFMSAFQTTLLHEINAPWN